MYILCHLLLSNLIPESYVAPDEIREDQQSLLRFRINLVQNRTRVMNRVHSLLDKYDVGYTYSYIFGKKGMRWLKAIKLEGNDHQVQINNYINNIEFLNNEINEIDKKIFD